MTQQTVPRKIRISARDTALIALFAALIAILTRLPGIPISLGIQSGDIEFSVPLYPLAGILLGPWVGALAVIIGNFIAWIIPTSSVLGLLLIPAGAFAALCAGFLTRQARWAGWKSAAVLLAVLIALWYVTPIGFEAPFYPFFLHVPALILILIFRNKIFDFVNSASKKFVTVGVGITSFVGVMADHMWGNVMFLMALEYVVNMRALRDALRNIGMAIGLGFSASNPMPPWVSQMVSNPTLGDWFMLSIPIATVERITFTLIATVIGVGVIMAIGKSFFAKSKN
ncbi:MAG: ECF transporter S component [Candidatus Bathyarchaeia archaeon]